MCIRDRFTRSPFQTQMGDGWPNHALLTFANPLIRNHFWRWIDQNPQQAPINLPGSKPFCKTVPKGYIVLGSIARATTSDSSSGLGSISSARPPRSSEVGSGSSWGDWCNRKPADDSGEPNDTTRHRDEDWENQEKPRGGPAAAGRTASAHARSPTTHKKTSTWITRPQISRPNRQNWSAPAAHQYKQKRRPPAQQDLDRIRSTR